MTRIAFSAPPVVPLALALGLAACQSVPTPGPPIEGFYASHTAAELSSWIGSAPARCFPSGSGTELCGWVIGNRYESWRTLANSIETRRKVNVVCEVPVPQRSDAREACSVYARESERFDHGAISFSSASDVSAAGSADRSAAARRILDGARTMRELSDLVGNVPDDCAEVSATERSCFWRLGNQSRGFDLVGAAVGSKKRVRLTCRLPADGSPRAVGTCQAAEDIWGSAPDGA